jgi:hypothetical protein
VALKPEHLPLPCSLRERVTERFAPDNAPLSSEALSRDELVAYLGKSKDTDNSPLATIQRRAAKAGRSAHLFPADHATLAWVCEAFDDWESNYPLESPLREQVHRLLPLAVAMALTDERFFVAGAHPLHQLLDSLQRGAVGWQARLDRAGQMLQQRVDRSVEKALEWFNDRSQDIAGIDRELEAANERDAARAQRMVQRLAETEEARLKTLGARREAAQRINALLEDFELPSAIGEFVKGAWYDSAQLVLVKHGEDSQDWREMQRTTRHLLESVQPQAPGDEVERDRRAQMLRLLPAELRRWLLSLEHDSEATDGAIGLVEYAHLRLQHGHQLELTRIPPLPVENPEQRVAEEDAPLTTGQWYRFSEEDGELRAQLVLQLENGQHLLFTNFVGLKALDLPQRAFRQRLHDGFANLLEDRASFSISLAGAAGIDSEGALRALVDPSYVPEETAAAEPEPAPQPPPPSEPTWQVEPQPKPEPATEQEDRSRVGDGSPYEREESAQAPPRGSSGPERETGASAGGPDVAGSNDELELTLDIEEEPAPDPRQAPPPVPPQQPPPDPPPREPSPDPSPEPPAPISPPPPPPVPPQQEAPPSSWQPAPPPPPPPQQPPAPPPQEAPPSAPATPPSAEREIEVPMGAWMGFHDGETPIMAKLAVYDPRRDNYIFVNRKGIALRELSRSELVTLMDQGLVDILETRSYFRDEVQRARGEER